MGDGPEPGYRCYRKGETCEVGETREERRAGRKRGCKRDGEGGCRYWVRNSDWGNCVLRVRHGEVYGQKETAQILGMSQQAVQAIEAKAWKKLEAGLMERRKAIEELQEERGVMQVMARNERRAWINV